ncbi:MAG: hypothetical protein PWP04_1877 [Candidatus Atribacteria bacterium]|nr:hypothetical protein [Candidatus Atribacteria bacterium]
MLIIPAISPKPGELLIKTTKVGDIDYALEKVFKEYVDLKLKDFDMKIKEFENKWKMDFNEFKTRLEEGPLPQDSYSFEVEQDFWEWEEVESLKTHYESLKMEWI